MNKVVLQIPMDATLRDQAISAAQSLGFSSLQETVRVFLHKLAAGQLALSFKEPPTQLSPRAARRYDKMVRNMRSGREPVYIAHSVDDLMDQLHDRKPPVQQKIP